MKKRIFFMFSVFVFLLAPGLCRAVEKEPHPEIMLIDYDGNEISLDSNIPYSPKNTCGECHEYDAITNAYHFQQGRTDADGNIIVDENCWNCHVMADVKKRGRIWKRKTDVHKAKGLTCIYCHPAGEDHEIAKGDILVGSVRNDIDGQMNSCLDCHLNGKDSRAPQPDHKFSDLHIEKIAYLKAISNGTDRFGCRIAYHTPVLVKGGMIYYMENNQLNKANMPTRDGGFKCCKPFDLSHNVVSGKYAIGAKGCKDCHTKPSPFFNRKILLDPFNRDGRPVYKEQWEILGYSRKRLKELTKERVIPTESLKK